MVDGDGCTGLIYLIPLNCALTNGQNGKFCVIYILQLKTYKGEGCLMEK